MAHFNHIALNVSDLEKSVRFYMELFDLKQIDEPFKQGKHIWLHIGDHCQLHLVHEKGMEKNTSSKWHYAYSVDNIENFIQKLEKANISWGGINDPSKKIVFRPDGIKQVYFQDPDGYWIEVNNDGY